MKMKKFVIPCLVLLITIANITACSRKQKQVDTTTTTTIERPVVHEQRTTTTTTAIE